MKEQSGRPSPEDMQKLRKTLLDLKWDHVFNWIAPRDAGIRSALSGRR